MGLFGLGNKDRRSHHRVRTPGLATLFGDVMDLSESGLGVFRKGELTCAVGDQIELDIRLEDHHLHAKAQVVRIVPLGFRRHEIGLSFLDLTADDRTAIQHLLNNSSAELLCPRAWCAA